MDYTFVDPDGETYTQYFNPFVTVGDARIFLPRLCSLPHRVRTIFFRNRKLADDVTFSSLDLSPGPLFSIEFDCFSPPPPPNPPIPPSIPFDESPYLRDLTLNIFEFRDGRLIPSTIQAYSGHSFRALPCFTSHVYKSEVKCHEGSTLSDFSIAPGSTLRVSCFPRLPRRTVQLFFKTRGIPNSRQPPHVLQRTFHAILPSDSTVQTLRRFVASVFDIDPLWVLLNHCNQILEDRFTLEYYNLPKHTLVDCAIGVMGREGVRIDFDRYGEHLGSTTAFGHTPAIMMVTYLADRNVPISQAFMVARPANEIVSLLVRVDAIARQNALAIRLYYRSDPVVKVLTGAERQHVVEVEDETTVYKLKCSLREVLGVPIGRQVITHVGDDDPLPDLASMVQVLRDDRVLRLISQEPSGQTVFVRADDSVVAAPIEGPLDSISDVKWNVGRRLGIGGNAFDLRIPGGRVENPEALLWQAAVSSYTVLVVMDDGEPVVPVVVTGGTNEWELDLPLRGSVRIVKQLFRLLGFGIGVVERLFYNGEYIRNDEALIGDLGIVPGSRIFISPCT